MKPLCIPCAHAIHWPVHAGVIDWLVIDGPTIVHLAQVGATKSACTRKAVPA